MKYLFLFLLIISTNTIASESNLRILQPRDTYIDLYKNETVRDTYIYPQDAALTYGANFVTNFDLVKVNGYGLWVNSRLHFDQDGATGKIKAAGWQYELGLTMIADKQMKPKVSAIMLHHSQHILEETRPGKFPVYDRVGVRLHITSW